MKKGDLISVKLQNRNMFCGYGIYLGFGPRGTNQSFYTVFWKGRIATFDPAVWHFDVINI